MQDIVARPIVDQNHTSNQGGGCVQTEIFISGLETSEHE
jgi:hypothetical protein